MKGKIGCWFIYTIVVLVLGMAVYKYRAEILDFLKVKYNQASAYAQDKAGHAVSEVKDGVKKIAD